MNIVCNRKRLALLLLAVFIFGFSSPGLPVYSAGEEDAGVEENVLCYFWGLCPKCVRYEEHSALLEDYPVEIRGYEVSFDESGRAKYEWIKAELGFEIYGFPTLVFNDQF
ncbi:MAG TPA: hypothetical protein VLH18_07895 [Candidatus Limnocylindrales bacterium]|nr:hypothetical protein [Candidatus Limnocylindrales bacterium]